MRIDIGGGTRQIERGGLHITGQALDQRPVLRIHRDDQRRSGDVFQAVTTGKFAGDHHLDRQVTVAARWTIGRFTWMVSGWMETPSTIAPDSFTRRISRRCINPLTGIGESRTARTCLTWATIDSGPEMTASAGSMTDIAGLVADGRLPGEGQFNRQGFRHEPFEHQAEYLRRDGKDAHRSFRRSAAEPRPGGCRL